MDFNRFYLVAAIQKANNKINIFKELLSVFYRLLEQEELNHEFITDFFFYNPLSEETIKFYLECKKLFF